MEKQTTPKYTRIEMLVHNEDLNKLYEHYIRLCKASPQGGWPALFGTKNYKRLCVRKAKMAKRFQAAVRKKFGIVYWTSENIPNIGGACIIWDEEKNAQYKAEKLKREAQQ